MFIVEACKLNLPQETRDMSLARYRTCVLQKSFRGRDDVRTDEHQTPCSPPCQSLSLSRFPQVVGQFWSFAATSSGENGLVWGHNFPKTVKTPQPECFPAVKRLDQTDTKPNQQSTTSCLPPFSRPLSRPGKGVPLSAW